MDLTALVESNATVVGVLLIVLFCLLFDFGITTASRLRDQKEATAEEKKRADEAETARREDRREHTSTLMRLADEVASSRVETKNLQSEAKTAIRTQNQLLKQTATALRKAGIEPEDQSWDS